MDFPKFNGLRPKFNGFHEKPCFYCGFSLIFMDFPKFNGLRPKFNGLRPKFNGLRPKLMDSHGFSWIFMDFPKFNGSQVQRVASKVNGIGSEAVRVALGWSATETMVYSIPADPLAPDPNPHANGIAVTGNR